MPSEQATSAAGNIASWLRLEAHQFPSDGNVSEWAKIIDAAFAPVVAERDRLKTVVESMQNHRDGKSRPLREFAAELRAES